MQSVKADERKYGGTVQLICAVRAEGGVEIGNGQNAKHAMGRVKIWKHDRGCIREASQDN